MNKQQLLEDPEIKALVENHNPCPTLTQIGPLAKKHGITSVPELWDFFDNIRALWSDHKDFESIWGYE